MATMSLLDGREITPLILDLKTRLRMQLARPFALLRLFLPLSTRPKLLAKHTTKQCFCLVLLRA